MTRREGGGEEGGWKMSRRQRGEVWRIWCRGSSRCFMVVNDHHHSFDGCWRCWWFQSITFLDRILFLVILLLPTVTIPPLVLLHWREKPRNIVYGYWRKGLLIHIFKLGFPFLSVDGCSPFHHYYDDYYGGLHFTIIMVVGVVLPAHSATKQTCSRVELQARTAPCREMSTPGIISRILPALFVRKVVGNRCRLLWLQPEQSQVTPPHLPARPSLT